MNEINIQYLSEEAVATIKGNIDKFTEIVKLNPNDSSAFISNLPINCFVDKKYLIPDFELKVSESGNYSDVDFDNTVMLYEHLKNLPLHVLSNERFWLWLILKKGYAAAVQAMPMSSGPKIILSHWAFNKDEGTRRNLTFGVLSRSFLRCMLTYDNTLEDPYLLTRFCTENYVRFRELTWRTYTNNKKLVRGIIKAEMKAIDKYGEKIEKIKKYYPSIAAYVSQLGSITLLDFESEDKITDLVFDYCKKLAEKNNITPQ